MAVEIRLGGMSIRSPRLSLLLAVALFLAGCAASPRFGESASTSPDLRASGGTPPAGAPASNPQAIPDPLEPVEHQAGDVVDLPDLSFSYSGLEAVSGQLRARFHIASGAANGEITLLLPDGSAVPTRVVDEELLSDVFGSTAAPPAKTSIITLRVAGYLVPFVVGSPR